MLNIRNIFCNDSSDVVIRQIFYSLTIKVIVQTVDLTKNSIFLSFINYFVYFAIALSCNILLLRQTNFPVCGTFWLWFWIQYSENTLTTYFLHQVLCKKSFQIGTSNNIYTDTNLYIRGQYWPIITAEQFIGKALIICCFPGSYSDRILNETHRYLE